MIYPREYRGIFLKKFWIFPPLLKWPHHSTETPNHAETWFWLTFSRSSLPYIIFWSLLRSREDDFNKITSILHFVPQKYIHLKIGKADEGGIEFTNSIKIGPLFIEKKMLIDDRWQRQKSPEWLRWRIKCPTTKGKLQYRVYYQIFLEVNSIGWLLLSSCKSTPYQLSLNYNHCLQSRKHLCMHDIRYRSYLFILHKYLTSNIEMRIKTNK